PHAVRARTSATRTRTSCAGRSIGSLGGRSMERRADRIAGVIAGVLRQALADSRAGRIVLLADGAPESGLRAAMLEPRLGSGFAGQEVGGGGPQGLRGGWARGAGAQPDSVVAGATTKAAALLGGALPGPLLPFGDLWASQVRALCAGWSGP